MEKNEELYTIAIYCNRKKENNYIDGQILRIILESKQ